MPETPSLPMFIDPLGLAEDLKGAPDLARLVSDIRRIMRMQSCIADLNEALDCCESIASSRSKNPQFDRIALEVFHSAALAHGISLYERAVSASSKRDERGSFSVRESMSEEQRADHDLLVKVRNRAIAHMHLDDEIDGEKWHRLQLFGVKLYGEWWPLLVSRRMHFDPQAFNRCRGIIPIARDLLEDRCDAEMSLLRKALNSPEIPAHLFQMHAVDPIKAFGSEEFVRKMLAASGSKGAAFLKSGKRGQ